MMILADILRDLEGDPQRRRKTLEELELWHGNTALQLRLTHEKTFELQYQGCAEAMERHHLPLPLRLPRGYQDLAACIGSVSTRDKPFNLLMHPITGAIAGVTVGECARRTISRRRAVESLLVGVVGGAAIGYLGAGRTEENYAENLERMYENALFLDRRLRRF